VTTPGPSRSLAAHGGLPPGQGQRRLNDWQADWHPEQPVAPLLFYRSHLQAANTGFIDVFCQRLQAAGLNPLPIAVASFKEPGCLTVVEAWLDEVCGGDDQHHRLCPIQP
jgi:cobaltochelatase CobN